MINFLEETKEAIKSADLKISDIIFIGIEATGEQCTWDTFRRLADMEYDDGYGGNEITSRLSIVFEGGGRLRREEYDGSEWWEYIRVFVQPKVKKKLVTVTTS